MIAPHFDALTRRATPLTLAALITGLKMGSAGAKGKKKGGKCRTRVRQVCRCPRCPIDILASDAQP